MAGVAHFCFAGPDRGVAPKAPRPTYAQAAIAWPTPPAPPSAGNVQEQQPGLSRAQELARVSFRALHGREPCSNADYNWLLKEADYFEKT